jgi:trk system potassium uptake protein TrkA
MSFCIIGIGRFGYHVATTLGAHHKDVIAIDSSESIIASIRDKVTQAICMRVTDEESLRGIGVEEIETVVVAMGENFAQSILVTALLKQKLKIPTVIARAISDVHKDILQLIGADHIVLPEQEMGTRLADKISLTYSNFIRITHKYSVSSMQAPDRFINQKVEKIKFSQQYRATLLGKKEGEQIIPIAPDYIIEEGDILAFGGRNKDLEKIARM